MTRAEEITAMINDCLFKRQELSGGKPKGNVVEVEGVVQKFGFHPERLASKKERLKEIISDLSPSFFPDSGGGFSFLHLPFDKDGNHWCEHPTAEALTALCIGNGLAQYCLPRDMWPALPGGVPYIVFSKDGFTQ